MPSPSFARPLWIVTSKELARIRRPRPDAFSAPPLRCRGRPPFDSPGETHLQIEARRPVLSFPRKRELESRQSLAGPTHSPGWQRPSEVSNNFSASAIKKSQSSGLRAFFRDHPGSRSARSCRWAKRASAALVSTAAALGGQANILRPAGTAGFRKQRPFREGGTSEIAPSRSVAL